MVNYLKRFLKILKLFIFCLKLAVNGHLSIKDSISINNFKDLWAYCSKWIDGEL